MAEPDTQQQSAPQAPLPGHDTVRIEDLRDTCYKAVQTLGYSPEDAQVLLDVMMYAQLRGNNQGIIKITTGGLNMDPTAGDITVEKDTRLSARINGNKNSGMVVLKKAVTLAKAKAAASGFAIVGTNNTSTSTGALGYFGDLIAQDGMIGIVLAQSPEFVAPHGAKQAIFGTNPICVSVPATGGPVTMDMATAAFAWFGLLGAQTAGQDIPGDVAFNAEGRPTTNPTEVLQGGAIRVFDRSYKGSNLALMVELLAGPLVGAALQNKLQEKNWGNLVMVVDPTLLGDSADFQRRVQVVLDRVRAAEPLPGVEEILLPGERGNRVAAANAAAGSLQVESNVWAGLQTMASKMTTRPPSAPAPGGSPRRPAQPRRPKIATMLCHPAKGGVKDPYAAMAPPLYQTATFGQPSAVENGPYDYTRSGNPTRDLLQAQMANLEGAHAAFAFTSGMQAIAVAVHACVKTGEHIVAGEDIYGGSSRLLGTVVPESGIDVTHVDTTDLAAVQAAVQPGRTKLLLLESPTNPRMQVCDLQALTDIAHAAGAVVCVDNSIMAPTFQQPLALGADISMTSATKFIAGHSDVTGGILSVRGEELSKRVYYYQNAEGGGLAPFDCWLAYRGLKTMALRMERQAENALKLASYLEGHPLVQRVNYAGLPSSPDHALHFRQATSGGSLLSFTTGDAALSRIIAEETELFEITVSFGSVSSLISLPCFMSHASIPAEVRAARGLPDDLVRISAGIEDGDDLIADLDQAMAKAAAAAGLSPDSTAGNGNGNGAVKPSARELELEDRVRRLEAMVLQQNGAAE